VVLATDSGCGWVPPESRAVGVTAVDVPAAGEAQKLPLRGVVGRCPERRLTMKVNQLWPDCSRGGDASDCFGRSAGDSAAEPISSSNHES